MHLICCSSEGAVEDACSEEGDAQWVHVRVCHMSCEDQSHEVKASQRAVLMPSVYTTAEAFNGPHTSDASLLQNIIS